MKHLLLALIPAVAIAQLVKFDPDGNPVNDSAPWQCVYDTKTRLTWEKIDTFSPVSWTYANNVNKALCNKTGWRLPTRIELQSLIQCPKGQNTEDWANGYPCLAYKDTPSKIIDSAFFPHMGQSDFNKNFYRYWTADTYDVLQNAAWFVNFSTGATDYNYKTELMGTVYVTDAQTNPTPKTSLLPTWNAAESLLTIPQFAANQGIKSVKLKLNLQDDSFSIIDYPY